MSILGNPITKLRPRFSRHRTKVRTYDTQGEEKETVRWKLKARMGSRKPFDCPLSLTLTFVFVKPKSRINKKEYYHTVKPDLDNLIKWIGDVGNGILWVDDKQICSIIALKRYGDVAKTEITISEVGNG